MKDEGGRMKAVLGTLCFVLGSLSFDSMPMLTARTKYKIEKAFIPPPSSFILLVRVPALYSGLIFAVLK